MVIPLPLWLDLRWYVAQGRLAGRIPLTNCQEADVVYWFRPMTRYFQPYDKDETPSVHKVVSSR